MALQTGQILDGKYRIIREIGHGSMGAVFEGENIMIHRRVAIKVLHPALAENSSTVQRFEREAQAAGRIGSDHIVEVLDLGSLRDGSYYMVMEFLEGLTLSKRMRSKGRLAPRELAPLAQQLLTGLEAAHKAGIVHRDLKPDNVFLQENRSGHGEFVKILDFGVSKFNPLNAEEHLALTRAGAVVGTPFYMSPEQAKGARDVDFRADLYSVGVILFEGVTGQKPFHAGTFSELIFKIVLEAPPPPEHFVPDLDPAFSRIIRRAMAREPSERYQSAAEMRDALSIWLHTGRDVAPGTQLAAPLPPPPSAGKRSLPPPPGSVEDDENAATRIVDPDEGDGGATQIVSASPLARAPSVRPAGPPAPPSRRPKKTVPLAAEKPPVGMPAGAPATSPRSSRPPGARPAASAAPAPAASAAPAPAASAAPRLDARTNAGGPAAAEAPAPQQGPAGADAAPGVGPRTVPATGPSQPNGAGTTDEVPGTNGSAGSTGHVADEASFAPTPPRGIPGVRPIASGRALSIAAGVLGVLALTAVGIGVVVAASGPEAGAPDGLTVGASQDDVPSRAALPTEPTATSLEETATETAEPAESATTEATSEPSPGPSPEAVAPTPAPSPPQTRPAATPAARTAPPPSPPPPTAPETPPEPTATSTGKAKQGRSYATEL